jgi:hypothetical protein
LAYSAAFSDACWAEANRGAAMPPATSDNMVLRLNMAPPLIGFAIDH